MKIHSVFNPQRVFSLILLSLFCFALHSFAQDKMDSVGKQQVMDMLKNVKNAIKSEYYDQNPKFGGMDIDARFKAAEEKLKTTDSLGQAFSIIAQAVVDLNDSHTRFWPPARPAITEYGWRMSMVGDKAFISGVLEKSDADKKGLRIGDEVLKVNGFRPTRKELWKMIYYYETLSPKTSLTLDVKSPTGEIRQLQIETKITSLKKTIRLQETFDLNDAIRDGEKLKKADRSYFKEIGNDVLVWKLPTFSFDPNYVGGHVGRANNKKTLILDLRGNGGGYVVTCEEMIGYFLDHDLKIADLKGRKKMDPQRAKTKGSATFKGKLIVLLDSNSASASEIFARTMQLEKRGIVLGDVSAGAVMQSRGVHFSIGDTVTIEYGMNMTMADVIMPDGTTLEHVGVIPDELILPTGQDLAERRDPVMARALELAGEKIESSIAGKFFPAEKFIERTSNFAIDWVY